MLLMTMFGFYQVAFESRLKFSLSERDQKFFLISKLLVVTKKMMDCYGEVDRLSSIKLKWLSSITFKLIKSYSSWGFVEVMYQTLMKF